MKVRDGSAVPERGDTPMSEQTVVTRPSSTRGPGTFDELPLLIPIPRAAELLGLSRSAAYRCAASGDLPTRHLGGRVYIVTAKLREFLESA
jgi:predicted DNA-binding transcriptional regulator AlpA